MKNKEIDFLSEEYWFDNEIHKGEDNFGYDYYANTIFDNLIVKLWSMPSEGYILVMGANRGISLQILASHFGSERVIGYDLYNPRNDPNIEIKDVMSLNFTNGIPLAFVHNDIGSYATTPNEKNHAQEWAARNIVPGGYLLGRNNFNVAKADNEGLLHGLGFKNYHFQDLQYFFDLGKLKPTEIEGHMLSIKCNAPELYNKDS